MAVTVFSKKRKRVRTSPVFEEEEQKYAADDERLDVIPIAQRMKLIHSQSKNDAFEDDDIAELLGIDHLSDVPGFSSNSIQNEQLEDEIARLEAELQHIYSNSDRSSVDGSDCEDGEENDRSFSGSIGDTVPHTKPACDRKTSEDTGQGNGTPLVFRSLEEERIPPLPSSMLPATYCRAAMSGKGKSNGKELNQNWPRSIAALEREEKKRVISEVVKGYVVADHRPFYCRVCKYQADSLEYLAAHRESTEHKEATEKEKMATFCRACRKQFTSPAQLQEHLKGKAHKDRMEKFQIQSRREKGNGAGMENEKAEGKNSFCYTFLRKGFCKLGDGCRFSHNAASAAGASSKKGADPKSHDNHGTLYGENSTTGGASVDQQSMPKASLAAIKLKTGDWKSGNCQFVRDEGAYRSRASSGSVLCKTWKRTQSCAYGDRCLFRHEKGK